jgi:hypothetical protein
MPPKLDKSILEAALVGCESQRQMIEARMQEIRQRLDGRGTPPPVAAQQPKRKRQLSKGGLLRIKRAQQKRWREARVKAAEEKHAEEAKAKRIAALAKARKALAKARKASAKEVVVKRAAAPTKTTKRVAPAKKAALKKPAVPAAPAPAPQAAAPEVG